MPRCPFFPPLRCACSSPSTSTRAPSLRPHVPASPGPCCSHHAQRQGVPGPLWRARHGAVQPRGSARRVGWQRAPGHGLAAPCRGRRHGRRAGRVPARLPQVRRDCRPGHLRADRHSGGGAALPGALPCALLLRSGGRGGGGGGGGAAPRRGPCSHQPGPHGPPQVSGGPRALRAGLCRAHAKERRRRRRARQRAQGPVRHAGRAD